MSLPFLINTESIRTHSDELVFDQLFGRRWYLEEIENAMEPYFQELIDFLTTKYDLREDQCIELEERLCWRLELLPSI